MYRFSANSRATISSTAIFLSQQSRQYFSSPRGSDTSLAPHSAQRDLATDLRGMNSLYRTEVSDFHRGTPSCARSALGDESGAVFERRRIHAFGVLLDHAAPRK